MVQPFRFHLSQLIYKFFNILISFSYPFFIKFSTLGICDIPRIYFFLLFGEFIEWDPIKVTTDLFLRFFACCHLAYFGILCNPVGDWLGQWFISGLLQASFLSYQLECDEWQLVLNPAVLLKWNDDGRIEFKLHKNGSSLQWVGFLWYVAKILCFS